MKVALKIAGSVIGVCVLLICSCAGYQAWRYHQPSDKKAEAFFQAHKSELAALVAAVQREPSVTFVSADWVGYGGDATNAVAVGCAKLLKKIGAQFLRRGDGAVEIYFWGDGCAICHDSYKGYAYILPDARWLRLATVVRSLDDRDLPKGKYAPVEDGSYILPLGDCWYIVRWERG